MRERKDGGAAFPCNSPDGVDSYTGMSLRDYFAGQALMALISKTPLFDRDGEFSEKLTQEYVCKFYSDISESAYCYADAMLEEREK